MDFPHQPVMVSEVIESLITDPDGTYVDGTVGNGGHSIEIAKRLSDKGRLVCLDRDADAIGLSKKRLKHIEKVTFYQKNFSELNLALNEEGIETVNGILLDLGMSTYQLDHSGRGFSFNRDEPLDMRMDTSNGHTAEEIVNNLPIAEIERMLRDYGEEKKARLISKAIDREREKNRIETSLQLANLIRSTIPPSHGPGAKDQATRTFQALRIFVNSELKSLDLFLESAPLLIKKGGRLVILTYHSLEDRIVKQAISNWEKGCTCPADFPYCVCGKSPLFRKINKKGRRPRKKEVEANPRARSAILRSAERI